MFSVKRAKYPDVSSGEGREFGEVESGQDEDKFRRKVNKKKKVWFSNIVDSDLARESKLRGELLSLPS